MSALQVIATLPKNARESVRVALDNYQGVDLIDIRVLAPFAGPAKEMAPTKKGLSMRVAQLPALQQALADAEVKARDLGLIPEGDVVLADPDLRRLVAGLRERDIPLGWGAVDAALAEIDRLRAGGGDA